MDIKKSFSSQMNNTSEKNVLKECVSCGGDSIKIGSSFLTQEKLLANHGKMFFGWLNVAKQKYSYQQQDIFICKNCGLIFIYPILNDEQTIQLIFDAINSDVKLDKLRQNKWVSVEFRENPLIWTIGVRVPTIQKILSGLLKKSIRLLDVGAHGGEISLHLNLPEGSAVDLLQLERSIAICEPRKNVRQFNGLLTDLAKTDYKANVVLALHVLEHCDNLLKFIQDLEKVTNSDGFLIIEVPYELHEVLTIARDDVFELPHHYYFTIESLRILIEQTKLEIIREEIDHNAHTGVGDSIYPVIRIVCRHRKSIETTLPSYERYDIGSGMTSLFPYTVDRLFKNFSGSLAFYGRVRFKVFVYWEKDLPLVNIFQSAPGYSGIVTSNPSLPFNNIFNADLSGIDFIFTLNEQDKNGLRMNLKTKTMIQ